MEPIKAVKSLQFRAIGFFALFIIISIGVAAIVGIRQMSNVVVEIYSKTGVFAVDKANSIVDGDSFEALAKTLDKNDPFYESARTQLLNIKEFLGIKYLYTMAPAEGSVWRFIIDGSAPPDDAEHFSALGDEEDTKNYDAAFKTVLLSGKNEVSRLAYQGERWGWLVTVYAPIVNSAGKTVGVIGCDFDGNALHNAVVLEQVMTAIVGGISVITGLLLLILFFSLQKKVDIKSKKIIELKNTMLKTMAEMLDRRDDITGAHINRTQLGVNILVGGLKKRGIYKEETKDLDVDLLLQSCQLHDIGKIAVSDKILKKTGRLNEDEFKEMQRHSAVGEAICEQIMMMMAEESEFLKYAKTFAGSHHEKWDGSGYPRGLKGGGIPFLGRVMAIADVYDALVSYRSYKSAFTHEDAVSVISASRETHFDPVLVDLFIEVADEFRDAYSKS